VEGRPAPEELSHFASAFAIQVSSDKGVENDALRDRQLELESVRNDIALLRDLIDRALDDGAGSQDPYLCACAELLHHRKKRLVQLEAITVYTSKGSEAA
jgi:hypothetical protein